MFLFYQMAPVSPATTSVSPGLTQPSFTQQVQAPGLIQQAQALGKPGLTQQIQAPGTPGLTQQIQGTGPTQQVQATGLTQQVQALGLTQQVQAPGKVKVEWLLETRIILYSIT